MVVWAKGFIDLERVNVEVEVFVSALQRVNIEPRREEQEEKKNRRKREKPQS